MTQVDLSLYLVLDPDLCAYRGMVETARAAVAGGATVVQLRDKHADTARMIETGLALKAVLAGTGALVVINDDVEAAIAIGADGLHIGQDDMDAYAARQRIGPEMILGLSVETQALAASVFQTPTKPDHKQPIGFAGLARLVEVCPVPAVAIGGLKAAHVRNVFAAGADGLAVVSAICGTPDPEAAARGLIDAIRKEAR
jgi:thiamine-phosphate pyrophosphorylase